MIPQQHQPNSANQCHICQSDASLNEPPTGEFCFPGGKKEVTRICGHCWLDEAMRKQQAACQKTITSRDLQLSNTSDGSHLVTAYDNNTAEIAELADGQWQKKATIQHTDRSESLRSSRIPIFTEFPIYGHDFCDDKGIFHSWLFGSGPNLSYHIDIYPAEFNFID